MSRRRSVPVVLARWAAWVGMVGLVACESGDPADTSAEAGAAGPAVGAGAAGGKYSATGISITLGPFRVNASRTTSAI